MINSNHSISALLRVGQWVSARAGLRMAPAALAAGSLLAGGFLLSACSDVPDEINPVSWYKGVEGWFSDEDESPPPSVKNGPATKTTTEAKAPATQTTENQASAPSDQPYPKAQDVPEKPATSTVEQRRQMMQGLSSDRANAKYADESARGSDQASSPQAGGNSAAPAKNSSSSRAPASAEDSDSMMPTVPPPAPSSAAAAPSSAAAPPAPAPSTGHKSYMSGIDTDTSAAPPAPPAPAKSMPAPAKSAPTAAASAAAPAGTGAVTPAAPGSAELNQVYQSKLQESAPTVSTLPAGPMAANAPPPGSVAEPPATPEGPATAPSKGSKKHAKTKSAAPSTAEAATSSPSVYVAPEVSEGDLAFGQSSTFGAAPIYDGEAPGAPGQIGVVYFGSGSAELDEGDVAKLRQVASMYQERGGSIRIVGYASSFTRDMDPMHHQMVNFNISLRRADTVARELIKLGVKPANVFVSARSDSEPIYFESMPAGQAGNQRAEIFIDY